MASFDPDARSDTDSGIFGLPNGPTDSALWLVPVPFDATTSYRPGAARGPEAILRASHQVDLFDLQNGRAYEAGIFMAEIPADILRASAEARILVDQERAGDAAVVEAVDAAGVQVNEYVARATREALEQGRIPGVVGGDHSVPFGAIAELAKDCDDLGILHIDAHADLRCAYEGFAWSHASIMDSVLRHVPGVQRIVQLGIRDFCEEELQRIHASEGRVRTYFDLDLRRRLATGVCLQDLLREVIEQLPRQVYVSLDVDGMDPSLAPNTGTPVPGGLSFSELCLLLETLADSGRQIVGFDLCEVAPGTDAADGGWDADVGARLLYKLCGFALRTGGAAAAR